MSPRSGAQPTWPTACFHAMGTTFTVIVEPGPGTGELLAEAEAEVRRLEERFSRFRPGSELSRLNREGKGTVSDEMRSVVAAALGAAARTRGRFDPTLLDQLERAGYDRPFPEVRARSRPTRPMDRSPGRWAEVVLDGNALRLPPRVRLDLGGIAKGWTADRIAEHLGARGGACVDAGGDLRLMPPGPDTGCWLVGVDDLRPDIGSTEDLFVLALTEGGVATSSTLSHRWGREGDVRHHLIDPRTGAPVVSDLMAVTVVAADAVRAETWAKATLIGGVLNGCSAAEEARVAALATGTHGSVYATGAMQQILGAADLSQTA